ncbi:ATP-dependent Clp protease proteolytic subunit [Palleronia sediminis]|nr:ATP-dependent Clp protease proteolytic subunit [Palleronia sediminis]
MSIETEIQDLRPILDPNLYVTLSGPIEDGDADRLRDVLSHYDSHDLREIFVFFDSPGGSLYEGLRIARVLGSRSEIVISQVGTDENPNAECASACVLAFIGADLRYLAANGRLGVHQFSHSGEGLDTGEGIDIAQRFAAEIVALLKRQRVSSTLFAEMSNTPPNAITWLSSDKLERWRVVTGPVYEDRMEYRNLNGKVALYMFHESLYGTNEMTLFCDDGLIAYAILDEPPVAAVGTFSFVVDGSDNRIDSYEILNRDNGRTRVFMRIPPQVKARLARATTIGARVYTPAGTTFWGFEQDIRDQKVAEIAASCPGIYRAPEQPATPARTAKTSQMTILPSTDFSGYDLTKRGHRGVSFEECQAICVSDRLCQAISYVPAKQWCWPKLGLGQRITTPDVVSAVR